MGEGDYCCHSETSLNPSADGALEPAYENSLAHRMGEGRGEGVRDFYPNARTVNPVIKKKASSPDIRRLFVVPAFRILKAVARALKLGPVLLMAGFGLLTASAQEPAPVITSFSPAQSGRLFPAAERTRRIIWQTWE